MGENHIKNNNLMGKFPNQMKTYCSKKHCKKHTLHKVEEYKAGTKSSFVQGKRRYDRKQAGYGGQTKPILRRDVKSNKKAKERQKKHVLQIKCTVCKYIQQRPLRQKKNVVLS